jgi:hypothetical protein
VTCTRTAGILTATGNVDNDTVSVSLDGPNPAAVYTNVEPAQTTIYQARNGMIDNTGKTAGKITVTAKGSTFTGTATFVPVTMPQPTTPPKPNTITGKFTVNCKPT